MLKYIAERILYTLPVAFGVSIVCFMLVHIAPGDPLTSILPPDASAQLQEEMRRMQSRETGGRRQRAQQLLLMARVLTV